MLRLCATQTWKNKEVGIDLLFHVPRPQLIDVLSFAEFQEQIIVFLSKPSSRDAVFRWSGTTRSSPAEEREGSMTGYGRTGGALNSSSKDV